MTTMQRQKMNYFLRTGEPLTPARSRLGVNSSRIPKVTIRPGTSKRRSRETIVQSGAYERERFVSGHPKVDRDKAKKHLQDMLAFGKDAEPTPRRIRRKLKPVEHKEEETGMNRFDQCMGSFLYFLCIFLKRKANCQHCKH